MLSAARLPQVRAEACISHYKPVENEAKYRTMFGRTKNSIKKRIVLPTTQQAYVKKIEIDWTLRDNRSLSSKFEATVADVNDPVTPIHSSFSSFCFAVCVYYVVS